MVVDDLHWADEPTLLLLRHVLRNIDRARLGVVGMYIDSEVSSDHRLRPALADLRSDLSIETVHLHGLSEDAVENTGPRLGERPRGPGAALHKLTDGNPLFLEEMLRQLTERGGGQANDGGEAPGTSRPLSPPRRSASSWPAGCRGCPRT